jgi:hypothetical protein
LSADPLKPLAEIRDCNLYVFQSECSTDGKYYVLEGLGGAPGNVTRIANLYDGLTGKKLGDLPTQNPGNYQYAWFDLDPTGTVLAYLYERGPKVYFLDLPTRAIRRRLDDTVLCIGPGARRWLMSTPATSVQPALVTLREQGHDESLLNLLSDSLTGKPKFSADGLHFVWCKSGGAVTVVDLVEVNRRLAELGLGW